MYRNVITELVSWYEEKRRRILFIKGAHGVGKTWTIKDFATAFFPSQRYIDCAQYPAFANVIAGVKPEKENTSGEASEAEASDDGDIEDSILLSKEDLDDMSIGARILDMDFLLEEHFENAKLNDCLLIFDNVQDIPDCANFFYEFSKSHKDYTICLIASTMEITEYEYSHQDVFNIIRMRPMTFDDVVGQDQISETLKNSIRTGRIAHSYLLSNKSVDKYLSPESGIIQTIVFSVQIYSYKFLSA